MKKYKVNVNGNLYEVTLEVMDGSPRGGTRACRRSAGSCRSGPRRRPDDRGPDAGYHPCGKRFKRCGGQEG